MNVVRGGGDPAYRYSTQLRSSGPDDHVYPGSLVPDPSVDPPPVGATCAVFLVVRPEDTRSLDLYDSQGARLEEHTFPIEIPIIEAERWGWLLIAPVLDVGMIIVLPLYGIAAGVMAVVN